jgi:hypothetical protein
MTATLTQESVRAGIRPFVEWCEQSRRPSVEEAAEVVRGAAIPVFLLEQLWATARRMMDRGVEHTQLVGVLDDLAGLTDRCLRAFGDVRAQAAALDPADARALEAAARNLTDIRAGVAKLLPWLKTPPPPIDPSRLAPDRGEREAPGFISADEFKARLRAK